MIVLLSDERNQILMIKDRKKLPIFISLIVSTVIMLVSLLGDCALYPILILLSLVFLMLLVFWVITLFVKKPRQWMLPVASAVLVYMGFNIMTLSRFKALLNQMTWDPSMLGLGIAVVAFGFALFSQTTLEQIEKAVQKISVQPEDKIDLPTETEDKTKLIQQLMVTPKTAEGEAFLDVTGKVTVILSKENAQRRLDEDTKKVGYQRGQIYQLENGSWAIHWGGKYPL